VSWLCPQLPHLPYPWRDPPFKQALCRPARPKSQWLVTRYHSHRHQYHNSKTWSSAALSQVFPCKNWPSLPTLAGHSSSQRQEDEQTQLSTFDRWCREPRLKCLIQNSWDWLPGSLWATCYPLYLPHIQPVKCNANQILLKLARTSVSCSYHIFNSRNVLSWDSNKPFYCIWNL